MIRRMLKRVLACLSRWRPMSSRIIHSWVLPSLKRGRAFTISWSSNALHLARTGIRRAFWFFVPWYKNLFLGLGVLLLLGLAYYFFWVIPSQQIAAVKIAADKTELSSKEFYELRNSIRQTFLQALGGAALLLGLYFTARTLRISQETLRTNQEGQVTERFTNAIEHLGDTQLTVRLGGIYALERIARDSPKDHWQIMEVLTAYVRDNAPWPPKTAQPLQGGQALENKQAGKNDQPSSSPEPFPKLATDIQAILTVLGRRTRSSDREGENSLDLTQTGLQGADLAGAHLAGARLNDAHLAGADLMDAHLAGADLFGAHLAGADLFGAHLEGADLFGAHLERATLMDAYLEGAIDLTMAQLATVRTLQGASLDPPLMEQLQREKPALFEQRI
jgi:Pentapeptide repeats (8 copies)